jgi:cyclic dehypoxanthinyl futalosine synthase
MAITRQQALDCFHSDDLIGIGMEADAVRRALHPEAVVTYVIDRAVCVTAPDMEARIAEALDAGATGLTLRGHLSTLAAWEGLLAGLRARYPGLWLQGLSATEVVALAAQPGMSLEAVFTRLQAAGLQSLSGADAGCLALEDPARCSQADWLASHRIAHSLGLPSTATMRFGAGETVEDRVDHLEALHALQRETGGFLSFRPSAAPLPNFEEATAVEYLKTLAIARMALDSIPHIEADWPAQGLKVLQMALRFGANDVGTTFPGDSLAAPGGTTEEDLRRVIRGAGLRPAQRDTAHRTLFLS